MRVGTVVFLHGGKEHGRRPVGRFDLPVLRIKLFERAIGDALRARGLGIESPRYSQQGWNDSGERVTGDVRRVLDAMDPDHRVVLVGHSMGGRIAVALGDHRAVAGIVGLAPWLPKGEPLPDLAGRIVRVAHGTSDRVTFARSSAVAVQRMEAAGVDARFTAVRGERHALLVKAAWWNRFVLDSVDEVLGRPASLDEPNE